MPHRNFDLFGAPPGLPEGFRYEPEILSREMEAELVARFAELPFKEFEFHGYTGKRRVVSYGLKYDFAREALEERPSAPEFLLPVRKIAARFSGVPAEDFHHILVTEYSAGSAIGWHRDKSVFGDVVGFSLLSPCHFRLRRKVGKKWERAAIIAEPRSVYLMRGPSRTEWEHSIPPVNSLRYSITLRTLRAGESPVSE
jgi:alkylated DNA repair dioxygenase AlkB